MVGSIDAAKVTGVLLVDGWHSVHNGSFTRGSFSPLWSQAFQFSEMYPGALRPRIVTGPLTAVLAVRHD